MAVDQRRPPVIHQLSAAIANQIAAGEVVERPAAVVKELAENSLDAGATRIEGASEDGGRRLIEISDDGHGMGRDDLRLAVSRHATSKLTRAEDLERIATLGFRGEALPSIAAVSEFAIASRPHGESTGWELRLNGGEEVAFAPCALSPGTRVTVRNLFWNVPARLKFLKSEAAETGHLTDQVVRLALSHPGTAFRLRCDGRIAVDLPASEDLTQRIRALFPGDLASSLIAVDGSSDTSQISGFIAHPRTATATARRQYLFLNGRFVRDRLLVAAVKEGFKGFLEPRLHGAVFLHIDLDPAQVDVNVHPTKSEVRFRREGEVFALVSRAIQKGLASQPGGFSLLSAQVVGREVVKPAAPMVVVQERYLPLTIATEPAPNRGPTAPVPTGPEPVRGGASTWHAEPRETIRAAEDRPSPSRYTTPSVANGDGGSSRPGVLVQHAPALGEPPVQPLPAAQVNRPTDQLNRPPAQLNRPTTTPIRRVLQLNRMYLLIETDTGIRLVDQHALHEKALLNSLAPSASDLIAGGRQELLMPIQVALSAAEVAGVAPVLPALAEFGIDAVAAGPTTIQVRAHPARLRRLDWAGFFADVAADGAAAVDGLRERLAHHAACRAAVKAGQELSPDEQRELAQLLFTLDGMEHCPHGRPTVLDLPWDELARRFQR